MLRISEKGIFLFLGVSDIGVSGFWFQGFWFTRFVRILETLFQY